MADLIPASRDGDASESLDSAATQDRKAAWWCWPVILLSLVPFGWLSLEAPAAGQEKGEKPAQHADQSLLAILKLQGEVVIATSALDPESAGKALDDLSETVQDNHSMVALALLERFVRPDSPRSGEVLARLSDDAPVELADLASAAVSDGLGDDDRVRLRDYVGWFADLAPGPGLSAPPRDQSIRSRAFIVMGATGLVFAAALFGIIAGAVLLILYLRQSQGMGGRDAFDPAIGPRAVMLECFALYLGIMTAGALAGAYLHESLSLISYAAAVVVPLLWPFHKGIRWADFCRSAGLHRGKGLWREVGAGFAGYLVVLSIASIGIALTLLLTLLAGVVEGPVGGDGIEMAAGPETHPLVGWIYSGTFWTRVACLLLASGFAPLFEELFFRGALQRYFRGRWRLLPSALLTGLIFAALHPQGFYAIPALASIGIGFSLLREWRDSLIAPIVAHAINNGILVGMLWWML